MAHLLIADDDDLLGEALRDFLMDEGHAVTWCHDGREALGALQKRVPDLVILDCNMPNMSGIEVLRNMRRSQHLCTVPVLMLTARTGSQDESIARFDGAHDYMVKPFDWMELIERVESLLRQPNKGYHNQNEKTSSPKPALRSIC